MNFDSLKLYLFVFVLFALPLIPLGYLCVSHRQQVNISLDFLKREKQGVEHLRNVFKVYLILADKKQVENNPDELQNSIEKIKIDILDNHIYGSDIFAQPKIASLQEFIISEPREQVLSKLLDIVSIITDNSNLILDGELDTYYLVDGIFLKFSKLLKYYEALVGKNDLTSSKPIIFDEFININEELKTDISKSKLFYKGKNDVEANYKLVEDIINNDFNDFNLNKIDSLKKFKEDRSKFVTAGTNLLEKLITNRIYQFEKIKHLAAMITTLLVFISLLISSLILRYLWNWRLGYTKKISEHKQTIEKALQLATAGEIFASIGHDISNPLQVIYLCTDRLRRLVDSHEIFEAKKINDLLDKIQKMTHQSESVIRNMNLLLKDNSDYLSIEFETNSLLNDLQELVQHRAAQSNVQIEFINECEKSILYTNRYAIIQILTNLINNAIDALKLSSQKRIEIIVKEEKGQILIIVQDTGPGIPKDIQERVFETLFTTKQNVGGTGLGLSISKKIAERLHCSLALENSEKGARFVLKIPHKLIIKKK